MNHWNYEKCWCNTCDIAENCSRINYYGDYIPVLCPMEITEAFNREVELKLQKGMHWIFATTPEHYHRWFLDQVQKLRHNLLPPIF